MRSIVPLTSCRICGNTQLEVILDLGEQALTGIFPKTAHTFDMGEMYGDQYGYRSGLNASMVRHLGKPEFVFGP